MKTMRGFWALILTLGAIGSGLFMLTAFSASQSAIHEIEALISALIVMVAVSAAYIGSVLQEQFDRVNQPQQPPPAQAYYPSQHGGQ